MTPDGGPAAPVTPSDTHTAVATRHSPRAAPEAALSAVPEIPLTSPADRSLRNAAIGLGSLSSHRRNVAPFKIRWRRGSFKMKKYFNKESGADLGAMRNLIYILVRGTFGNSIEFRFTSYAKQDKNLPLK